MLASITLVALNNARMKGRDAKRLSDMQQIYNALYSFYLDKGCLPIPQSSGCIPSANYPVETTAGAWDMSSITAAGTQGSHFLPFLATYNYLTQVPVDPVNNAAYPMLSNTFAYRYYCYPVGSGNDGLHLGYFSEITGQEVIYSVVRTGQSGAWSDSNFICK